MLVDFAVQPYLKRIFVLSEVHKQSDINTILASSVWDEIERAAQAQNLRSSESFIAFLSFSERIYSRIGQGSVCQIKSES
mgnify:FL=1